jgi:hypothetical protein
LGEYGFETIGKEGSILRSIVIQGISLNARLSEESVGLIRGYNLYGFVLNRPINSYDIFGLALPLPPLPPGTTVPPGQTYCGSINGTPVFCELPKHPTPPKLPPVPLAPKCLTDPYGCWAQSNTTGINIKGPVTGISASARYAGCNQCCNDLFPINGGSTPDWTTCTENCWAHFHAMMN